jgi:hypothetical protein
VLSDDDLYLRWRSIHCADEINGVELDPSRATEIIRVAALNQARTKAQSTLCCAKLSREQDVPVDQHPLDPPSGQEAISATQDPANNVNRRALIAAQLIDLPTARLSHSSVQASLPISGLNKRG